MPHCVERKAVRRYQNRSTRLSRRNRANQLREQRPDQKNQRKMRLRRQNETTIAKHVSCDVPELVGSALHILTKILTGSQHKSAGGKREHVAATSWPYQQRSTISPSRHSLINPPIDHPTCHRSFVAIVNYPAWKRSRPTGSLNLASSCTKEESLTCSPEM